MIHKILIFAAAVQAYSPEEALLYGNFPQDFVWGAATAAYQVYSSHKPVNSHVCTDRGRLG